MHWLAFIHKKAEITLRLGQGQGALQGRQSQGKVPLCLVGERLRHQDFNDTAGPSLRFGCFQQALQQSDRLEDRVIAPLALVLGDQHPGQNEMLEFVQVA